MSTYILVVDDEPEVEHLFRQQFRREIRSGRFVMENRRWELLTNIWNGSRV
jgi:hypothetical protein